MKFLKARLGALALGGKVLSALLILFTVANFAYFLIGSSPYTSGDMLALMGILIGGLIIIFASDAVFRFFWKL